MTKTLAGSAPVLVSFLFAAMTCLATSAGCGGRTDQLQHDGVDGGGPADVGAAPPLDGSPSHPRDGSLPSEAKLASLAISGATLAPSFSPDTTSYATSLAGTSWDGYAITITALAADPHAGVTIGGVVSAGGGVRVPLGVGKGAVPIEVLAADGVTRATYTIETTVGPSEKATFAGSVVALSDDGSTLAVGAPFAVDGTGSMSGAVYVRTRSGETWSPPAALTAPNVGTGERGGELGTGLALSADGSTLAVGAPWESSAATGVNSSGSPGPSDTSAPQAGAVYVFRRAGGAWSLEAYVKAPDTSANAYFGHSVALSADGSTLVAGAYLESTLSPDTGAAYVLTRSGTTWSHQAKLRASNAATGATGGAFGQSVALSSDGATLAVGAPRESSGSVGVNAVSPGPGDRSAPQSGAAYVFTRSGATWSPVAYVKASNTTTGEIDPPVTGEAGGVFGYDVTLSGDGRTLAVGAPLENSGATGVNGPGQDNRDSRASGAVYVFESAAGAWSQVAYVKASNTRTADQAGGFGESIALSTDGLTLVSGATHEASGASGVNATSPGQDDTSIAGAGAAYVFRRTSGTWGQRAYVKASHNFENGLFGRSVTVAVGGTLAVGQEGDGTNTQVYVFR